MSESKYGVESECVRNCPSLVSSRSLVFLVLTGMLFISSGTCICAIAPSIDMPSTHNDINGPSGHIFNKAADGNGKNQMGRNAQAARREGRVSSRVVYKMSEGAIVCQSVVVSLILQPGVEVSIRSVLQPREASKA